MQGPHKEVLTSSWPALHAQAQVLSRVTHQRQGRGQERVPVSVCSTCTWLILLLSMACTTGMGSASIASHAAWSTLDHDAHSLEPSLHQQWQRHFQQLCSIHVGQQPLCSLMGPLLHHNFSTSVTQLRRGLTYLGPNHRLRRVVRDLFVGKTNISIGVIGTSVSYGTGSSLRGVTDWFSRLGHTLQASFPNARLKLHNGCFPGTPSSFANMCLSKMVKNDVDLLFIEYVTNDFLVDSITKNPMMRAYERLIRKVLRYKNRPAVVLLQVVTWGQSFPVNDTKFSGYKKWFHESAEDQYGSIAQYYGLPWLSYRNAVWIDAEYADAAYPIGWKALTNDYTHPNDNGHKVLLDLIVWLVQQTAINLLTFPFSRLDAAYVRQRLPPPMHPGNQEEQAEMCLMDAELQALVRNDLSSGWAFVNEGTADKPKTGYVATAAGSKLVLEVNLDQVLDPGVVYDGPEATPQDDRSVHLMISHLKSYTSMGQAKVTCDVGCACADAVLDAQHNQQTSTTFMHMLEVLGLSNTCQVSVTVLHNSSSNGHKFKVSAIMINRKTALGFGWPDEGAVFMAKEVFSGDFGQEELESNQKAAVGHA